MRRIHAMPPAASYAWLLDLLFSVPPAVTWAPAGRLPAGCELAGQFAVLPAGGSRAFLVSLASRRAAASALTSYNALRPARRRAERQVLGLALLAGFAQPLLRHRIDVGVASGTADTHRAVLLIGEHLAALFEVGQVVIACGGGTGPYRKPVLQVFSMRGAPLGYVKIGWNGWTRAAVRSEAAALRACAESGSRLGVPALLHHGTWNGLELLVTAPLPGGVRRHPDSLPDASLLRAISQVDPAGHSELAASSWWAGLRGRVTAGVTDQAARGRLTRIADGIERSRGDVRLEFGRWHGDLVPWNLARLGAATFAWDWESSTAAAPVGFDALHFGFQVAFVARRTPLARAAALAARQAQPALTALAIPASALDLLPLLHLLELAVRHEEARSATGDADGRFFPEVLSLLENSCLAVPGGPGPRAVDRAA